jgi:hypothetical protein
MTLELGTWHAHAFFLGEVNAWLGHGSCFRLGVLPWTGQGQTVWLCTEGTPTLGYRQLQAASDMCMKTSSNLLGLGCPHLPLWSQEPSSESLVWLFLPLL